MKVKENLAKIIDGKKIAEKIQAEIKNRVSVLKEEKGQVPGLCCLQVGKDPESQIYLTAKKKTAKDLGFYFEERSFAANDSAEKIAAYIQEKNSDNKIHGIVLQLPLPSSFDTVALLKKIHPFKDVDGLHPKNLGLLLLDKPIFIPATTKAILTILKNINYSLEGKEAVILGRSNLVGKPTALALINSGATVTVCRSATKNLNAHTKKAELLISAVGKSELVKIDMVKKGAVVIDVGISREDGKIKGDVDPEVAKKASIITPVPGGVGPLTVVCLMENTLLAFERTLDEKSLS